MPAGSKGQRGSAATSGLNGCKSQPRPDVARMPGTLDNRGVAVRKHDDAAGAQRNRPDRRWPG
jgi:hypothetical protein